MTETLNIFMWGMATGGAAVGYAAFKVGQFNRGRRVRRVARSVR